MADAGVARGEIGGPVCFIQRVTEKLFVAQFGSLVAGVDELLRLVVVHCRELVRGGRYQDVGELLVYGARCAQSRIEGAGEDSTNGADVAISECRVGQVDSDDDVGMEIAASRCLWAGCP